MRRFDAAAGLALIAMVISDLPSHGRELSIEDRARAQTAIERVYWAHRIWPSENVTAKPPLEELLPASAIRAKVEDALRKSNALEKWWGRPITSEQLQAEMMRMARDSRQPQVLRELLDALGRDPFLVAECLARPVLADRLIRSWYAADDRFHGEMQRRILAALGSGTSADSLLAIGGRYQEAVRKRGTSGERSIARGLEPGGMNDGVDESTLAPDEWDAFVKSLDVSGVEPVGPSVASSARPLRETAGSRVMSGTSPLGVFGRLTETAETFSAAAMLSRSEGSIRTATISWEKTSFDSWWQGERLAARAELDTPDGPYALATPASIVCTDDTWMPTVATVPVAAAQHTAVWTGSEMIVWGGSERSGARLNQGGRYTPATGTWVQTNLAGAPSLRKSHTAVWTGSEMIVWGGDGDSSAAVLLLDSGGRYNPVTDSWLPTSTGANLPDPRNDHTAVWTGSVMIIWGGAGSSYLNTGSRYDPVSDSWSSTSQAAAPSGRGEHVAVWTGSRMIVWGGAGSGGSLNTGGIYNPVANSWSATSTANAPGGRRRATGVWTGTEMIVWGGSSGSVNVGGRYNPSTNTWQPTSTGINVPIGRDHHSAVWTGTRMIVWGGSTSNGYVNSGGIYDPVNDLWQQTSQIGNAPNSRGDHTAIWTGSEMIVWGGDSPDVTLDSGGRYDPLTDTWIPTEFTSYAPAARQRQSAVWSGSEMIIWGGGNHAGTLRTGGRYDPALDSWSPTGTTPSYPRARQYHSAVWTGTRMIVWGGAGAGGTQNTGDRYDPASDAWTPTSTGVNAPSARYYHSAVWTGAAMIVWGGQSPTNVYLYTGARYDPSSDGWTTMLSGPTAPSPRSQHTSVWTGSEMIVWGGLDQSGRPMTGGKYHPTSDAWTLTDTGTNTPSGRNGHSAVWTGTEMIVWGGFPVNLSLPGGRYDPLSDQWSPTGPASGTEPAPRYFHSAVWTGSEMIVFGGTGGFLSRGGAYKPATGTWRLTSSSLQPSARLHHSAVWTGNQMIIWGGGSSTETYPYLDTGARYCTQADCAATLAEVQGMIWLPSTKTRLQWNPVPGASIYEISVGGAAGLPHLLTDDSESCPAGSTPETTTGETLISIPAPGRIFWYLVRARGNCDVAGPAGDATSGPRRQSAWECSDAELCTEDLCNPDTGCAHLSSCNDLNACSSDSCDPIAGCQHLYTCPGAGSCSCDDGNACTSDACSSSSGCSYSTVSCAY